MLNILVFKADCNLRDSLATFLQDEDCRITTSAGFPEAVGAVMRETFDLILCDFWTGEADALSFFHTIRDRQPMAVKVLMAGYPTPAMPSDLRKAGVDYVIHKSEVFNCMNTLKNSLAFALQRRSAKTAH